MKKINLSNISKEDIHIAYEVLQLASEILNYHNDIMMDVKAHQETIASIERASAALVATLGRHVSNENSESETKFSVSYEPEEPLF